MDAFETSPNFALAGRRDLISYLGTNDWAAISNGSIGELWESPSGRQVGIPYDVRTGSLDWRSVLERVADDARLTVQELSNTILGLWVDTFAFRASSDIYIQDTIPAKAGADLFKNVWKLLRAAATTSRTPKARISGNWSKVGDEAIEDARFGHTQKGSYILPLLVPLPRPVGDEPDTFMLNPHGNGVYHESDARRVSRTMIEALGAVNSVLIQPEREPAPSVVADLVHVGVSREFITAINDIIKHQSVADLDVRVDWADRSPGPSQAPKSIVIPSEASYRLGQVAPLFKNARKPETETLTGPIYKMADREGDQFGIATMEVPRNGRTSQIDVFLGRDLLTRAHDWFKDHKTILVEGRVENSPHGLVMRKPARFELIGATMFFENDLS